MGLARPEYVERDIMDMTPAQLQPLDLSSGCGSLSSPDPADHHPWDRPLFRRVIVRPAEKMVSRIALVSPRPLLIGLIAILAKEIATRQFETDLLNTPDDAVWKPGATGVLRQAQANLDRRIKTIVRKGYRAMLQEEIRAVREDPFGTILYNNLLGKASSIFTAQVSNVTMELASSFEDQLIDSLEIITSLSEVDENPALSASASTRELSSIGAPAGTAGSPPAPAVDEPTRWLSFARVRVGMQRLTQLRRAWLKPQPGFFGRLHRPVVGDVPYDTEDEIERVSLGATAQDGWVAALSAARVGTSSAAEDWARRRADVSPADQLLRLGAPMPEGERALAGAIAVSEPRVPPEAPEAAGPPPTGLQRLRTVAARAWAGSVSVGKRGLTDARQALAGVASALPQVSVGVPPASQAILASQQEIRSRLRGLLSKVDALVEKVDRDGNEELTLDELLALFYDDAGQLALRPAQPEDSESEWGSGADAPSVPAVLPAAIGWAEGLDPELLSAIRSTVLIKSSSRARNMWDRLQAIAMAPVVVGLNRTGAAARASVQRFGRYVADADLNRDGQLSADEVLQALLGDDIPVCEPLRTQLGKWVVFSARRSNRNWWESVPDALAVQALVDLNSTGVVRATALAFQTVARALNLPEGQGYLTARRVGNATSESSSSAFELASVDGLVEDGRNRHERNGDSLDLEGYLPDPSRVEPRWRSLRLRERFSAFLVRRGLLKHDR